MKRRLLNILVSLDQFALSLLTLGWAYPDETISAFLYRMENSGTATVNKLAGFGRMTVDFIIGPIEKQHCFNAFRSESARKHLHSDYFRESGNKQ